MALIFRRYLTTRPGENLAGAAAQLSAELAAKNVALLMARGGEPEVAQTFEDYEGDAMLRSTVERQFEMLGEALSRLSRSAPELASRISQRERSVAFRNVLIHGYASVDDRIVWGVLKGDLPNLLGQIEELLNEEES